MFKTDCTDRFLKWKSFSNFRGFYFLEKCGGFKKVPVINSWITDSLKLFECQFCNLVH